MNDIIGFAAILSAGAYGGYHYAQPGPWTATDFILIAVLLAIGFFFSVVLS
jgi:hypothetical protein